MGLRSFIGASAMLLAGLASTAASAQVNVYGRVDIGGIPMPPSLIFPQPVIIAPPRVAVHRAPIYLHVPIGHSRHWSKHCHRYNACGQPVYFVQNDWYQNTYRPYRYRHAHPVRPPHMHPVHPGPGPRHDMRHDRREDRHDRRHDRRDERRDDRRDDRGHDRGNGHDRR